MYDPFLPGRFAVGATTLQASDAARGRVFPVEIWRPAGSGARPLVVFSHHGGGNRRAATYLCTHLASHGYAVAALDHSEVVAPELQRPPSETDEQRAARMEAQIASRVPDLRLLVDFVLRELGPSIDAERIGAVGHSFGGWTVLEAARTDPRLRAVVALAPGGASNPKPGILPLRLSFGWPRLVPALYLAAENDVSLPLEGMNEIFARAPSPKRLFVLRRADHLHFVDDVEKQHEAVRAMPFPPVLSWIPREMKPISELCSGEEAHRFARACTLAHLDAALRGLPAARAFDVMSALAAQAIDAFEVQAG